MYNAIFSHVYEKWEGIYQKFSIGSVALPGRLDTKK
jgi:hypothetical protein